MKTKYDLLTLKSRKNSYLAKLEKPVNMGHEDMAFEKIQYSKLNAKQKENYNFQKVSAILADYGFVTIRLSDDWEGADFLAYHIDGLQQLKVQLKGRFEINKKYKDKHVWICFPYDQSFYIYPHDEALNWAVKHMKLGQTTKKGKFATGVWNVPKPTEKILSFLTKFGRLLKQ